MIEPISDYDEKFNQIKKKYIENLKNIYIIFSKYRHKLCSNKSEENPNFNELRLHVHKLAGSSTMLGFSELGRASKQFESILIANEEDNNKNYCSISNNFRIFMKEVRKTMKPAR